MLEILKIVLQWKKKVFGFTVLAVLASVIITMPFIMPPYYKSKMVFYVSNPTSTDRAALFNEKEVGGVSIFGGKEDMNRFLTILNSAPVSLAIIEKYGLTKHYKIKGDNKSLSTYYTQKEFHGNFDAIRDDLGAIEVSVIDTDAKLASSIVKDIVSKSDSIYRSMLVETKSTVLSLIDKQIAEKKPLLQTGVSENTADELKKMMSIRDQYVVSSSAAFKTLYIVEEPTPAVKKTKPVRWLTVLATAVAAFFLASFVALLIELYKHADKYGFQRS